MTHADADDAYIAAADKLKDHPSQENYNRAVALTTAHRLLGLIDAVCHAYDLRFLASHWPQEQGDTCPQED